MSVRRRSWWVLWQSVKVAQSTQVLVKRIHLKWCILSSSRPSTLRDGFPVDSIHRKDIETNKTTKSVIDSLNSTLVRNKYVLNISEVVSAFGRVPQWVQCQSSILLWCNKRHHYQQDELRNHVYQISSRSNRSWTLPLHQRFSCHARNCFATILGWYNFLPALPRIIAAQRSATRPIYFNLSECQQNSTNGSEKD
jgi:hypothetical protein